MRPLRWALLHHRLGSRGSAALCTLFTLLGNAHGQLAELSKPPALPSDFPTGPLPLAHTRAEVGYASSGTRHVDEI